MATILRETRRRWSASQRRQLGLIRCLRNNLIDADVVVDDLRQEIRSRQVALDVAEQHRDLIRRDLEREIAEYYLSEAGGR